ncbi:MAG TPA: hypothetical protein VFQ30_19050 [Ktedonobacteraceae bacterium]|nr:hypothetical protein [Ktedonobacteraceae bacterium]
MGKTRLLTECTFGWGQKLRLYTDYLDIDGTPYALSALTHVHPMFRTVMGIASARLELRFGKKKVLLRGIAEVEAARFVVAYLSPWCWEDAQHVPAPVSPPVSLPASPASQQRSGWDELMEEVTLPGAAPLEQAVRRGQSQRLQGSKPRLRSVRLEREASQPPAERPARKRRERKAGRASHMKETLTVIPVPLRLLPGEEAYYYIEATLCDEPIGTDNSITYPAKDHGKLMLTNQRIIYMGRKSQVVIDYAHLLQVSRLRGAIAIQSDYRYRREIFELRRPLECAEHLETILEHYAQTQETQAGDEVTLVDEAAWAARADAAGAGEGNAPTEEISTGNLGELRHNWRWRVARLQLRNTGDYENGWQNGRGSQDGQDAEDGGDVWDEHEAPTEEADEVPGMVSEGIPDAVSQEPGGKDGERW